jgi:hypothetical protein
MYQEGELPNRIDQESFMCITNNSFDLSVFNKLCNEHKVIEKQIFLDFYATATDVFLTHDWGKDELERDNHERVMRMNRALQERGLSTWFDGDRMRGNIREKMTEGINESVCVVVFITERYIQKVAGKGPDGLGDNCRFEFDYAARSKHGKLIPVIMEKRCLASSHWYGLVSSVMGGALYFDYTSDDNFEATVDSLYAEIRKIVGPTVQETLRRLKSHSPTFASLAGTSATITVTDPPTKEDALVQSWREWLEQIEDITPTIAHCYAQTLVQKGVSGPSRLGRKVARLGEDCLRDAYGLEEEDAEDVLLALRVGGHLKHEGGEPSLQSAATSTCSSISTRTASPVQSASSEDAVTIDALREWFQSMHCSRSHAMLYARTLLQHHVPHISRLGAYVQRHGRGSLMNTFSMTEMDADAVHAGLLDAGLLPEDSSKRSDQMEMAHLRQLLGERDREIARLKDLLSQRESKDASSKPTPSYGYAPVASVALPHSQAHLQSGLSSPPMLQHVSSRSIAPSWGQVQMQPQQQKPQQQQPQQQQLQQQQLQQQQQHTRVLSLVPPLFSQATLTPPPLFSAEIAHDVKLACEVVEKIALSTQVEWVAEASVNLDVKKESTKLQAGIPFSGGKKIGKTDIRDYAVQAGFLIKGRKNKRSNYIVPLDMVDAETLKNDYAMQLYIKLTEKGRNLVSRSSI